MSESQYDEKQEEKEEEKRAEKSYEEKWRDDPVGAAVWAGILIWAGIALLLGNLGVLDNVEALDGWDLVFAGAGVILLIEVAVRVLMPAYRRGIVGSLILGMVFLTIGLGDLVDWGNIWPIAIILIGLYLLLRGIGRR
jgi:hypothetical protein